MKLYSIKLNDEQFEQLFDAWSQANVVFEGIINNSISNEKMKSAKFLLKSEDAITRKVWELMWTYQKYESTIKTLETMRHQGDAEYEEYFTDLPDFTIVPTDILNEFNFFIYDSEDNKNKGEVPICFQSYWLVFKYLCSMEKRHEVKI